MDRPDHTSHLQRSQTERTDDDVSFVLVADSATGKGRLVPVSSSAHFSDNHFEGDLS